MVLQLGGVTATTADLGGSTSGELYGDRSRWAAATINNLFGTNVNDPSSIERAAKLYRNAACRLS